MALLQKRSQTERWALADFRLYAYLLMRNVFLPLVGPAQMCHNPHRGAQSSEKWIPGNQASDPPAESTAGQRFPILSGEIAPATASQVSQDSIQHAMFQLSGVGSAFTSLQLNTDLQGPEHVSGTAPLILRADSIELSDAGFPMDEHLPGNGSRTGGRSASRFSFKMIEIIKNALQYLDQLRSYMTTRKEPTSLTSSILGRNAMRPTMVQGMTRGKNSPPGTLELSQAGTSAISPKIFENYADGGGTRSKGLASRGSVTTGGIEEAVVNENQHPSNSLHQPSPSLPKITSISCTPCCMRSSALRSFSPLRMFQVNVFPKFAQSYVRIDFFEVAQKFSLALSKAPDMKYRDEDENGSIVNLIDELIKFFQDPPRELLSDKERIEFQIIFYSLDFLDNYFQPIMVAMARRQMIPPLFRKQLDYMRSFLRFFQKQFQDPSVFRYLTQDQTFMKMHRDRDVENESLRQWIETVPLTLFRDIGWSDRFGIRRSPRFTIWMCKKL
ncbi:hypothetical protein KEM48_006958 [Puccinia striiformis f. sp. tritici PST-130]|nr:hypothetical protein KEM48_006958 [Puccinia striiformis f. sp. tritici PST-130]